MLVKLGLKRARLFVRRWRPISTNLTIISDGSVPAETWNKFVCSIYSSVLKSSFSEKSWNRFVQRYKRWAQYYVDTVFGCLDPLIKEKCLCELPKEHTILTGSDLSLRMTMVSVLRTTRGLPPAGALKSKEALIKHKLALTKLEPNSFPSPYPEFAGRDSKDLKMEPGRAHMSIHSSACVERSLDEGGRAAYVKEAFILWFVSP